MKTSYPYQVVLQRVDIIYKVPRWAVGSLYVGQLVLRLNGTTVQDMLTGKLYRYPESYTKFSYYS